LNNKNKISTNYAYNTDSRSSISLKRGEMTTHPKEKESIEQAIHLFSETDINVFSSVMPKKDLNKAKEIDEEMEGPYQSFHKGSDKSVSI
jgi:hypothetical protein